MKTIKVPVWGGWIENRNGFKDIDAVQIDVEFGGIRPTVYITGQGLSGRTLRGVMGMSAAEFAQVCQEYLKAYKEEFDGFDMS